MFNWITQLLQQVVAERIPIGTLALAFAGIGYMFFGLHGHALVWVCIGISLFFGGAQALAMFGG